MKIAILGATGFVGKVLLSKVLESGHEVKALVRDPEKLGELRDHVEYVVGDALDPESVSSAVAGSEVVLSTIAPSKRNPGDPHRYEKTMKNIVSAMEAAGLKRLIHIGGAGYSVGEDEQWTMKRRLLRGGLLLFAKPILDAKWLEWKILSTSSIDWTLIRPPAISTTAPSGSLVADEKRLPEISVNILDLADFMIQQITSSAWIRKSPLVSSRRKERI